MAYISKRNRRREREIRNGARNRREIIAARLSRRDLIKDLERCASSRPTLGVCLVQKGDQP
jgi:hypothetical protein